MKSTAQIINDNFLYHSIFLQSQTPQMEVVKKDGLSYSDSGLSCDTFNIIYITNGDLQPHQLADAINHFEEKQFEFCIWINEENRTQNVLQVMNRFGLQQAGSDPGMILDLQSFDAPIINADIRKITTKPELEVYANIVSLNWHPADMNVIRYYHSVADTIFNNPHIQYYAYYADGHPVAAVELFPDNDENVGLYSLCTLANARGKGIGTNLMKYSLNQLKQQGYKTVTLQASDDGLNIYKRLGFTEKTRFYEYKK